MKQATVAAIRFGYGLGSAPLPATPEAVAGSLLAPDRMREAWPLTGIGHARTLAQRRHDLRKARKDGDSDAALAEQALKTQAQGIAPAFRRMMIARCLDSTTPLRERLTHFWMDHFTTRLRADVGAALAPSFVDEAIRSNLTGRFADMLKAVVTHPQMLYYLDQIGSVGPNSVIGRKQGRGLNENLARELLELHTLGVSGAYTQNDVRQLAELLTGLHNDPEKGFMFRTRLTEPGAEQVLGKSYGGGSKARLSDIYDFLEDVAVHPDTARHVSGKLAVHFVADRPDSALIDHMTGVWRATGGDLRRVCDAMLEHPAAWRDPGGKVKLPLDFIVSALRALGLDGAFMTQIEGSLWRRTVDWPMNVMGQRMMGAPGPDGWPENAEAWITPLGLSTRIRWAMRAPRMLGVTLEDPRIFVRNALDDAASQDLIRAAGASETIAQGVGLILASPEFNRR